MKELNSVELPKIINVSNDTNVCSLCGTLHNDSSLFCRKCRYCDIILEDIKNEMEEDENE
jgi:ribosomal protein L40E